MCSRVTILGSYDEAERVRRRGGLDDDGGVAVFCASTTRMDDESHDDHDDNNKGSETVLYMMPMTARAQETNAICEMC